MKTEKCIINWKRDRQREKFNKGRYTTDCIKTDKCVIDWKRDRQREGENSVWMTKGNVWARLIDSAFRLCRHIFPNFHLKKEKKEKAYSLQCRLFRINCS